MLSHHWPLHHHEGMKVTLQAVLGSHFFVLLELCDPTSSARCEILIWCLVPLSLAMETMYNIISSFSYCRHTSLVIILFGWEMSVFVNVSTPHNLKCFQRKFFKGNSVMRVTHLKEPRQLEKGKNWVAKSSLIDHCWGLSLSILCLQCFWGYPGFGHVSTILLARS